MQQTESSRRNPAVVIIGAGMTGILMAIKLREAGIEDITLLETKDRVGGTWRENTYPGVACDIPSFAYTYDSEPNPNWSHLFARGAEIQAYFEKVFQKHGLAEVTRFNERVTACTYDEGRWTVQTSTGQRYHCDLLFSAQGILHVPAKPDFPGMADFRGALFHTAEWDHSASLENRKIGVIGTGSTACQAIPELVDLPGTEVTVFQRTPQWVVDAGDMEYDESHKAWLARHPALARLQRSLVLRLLASVITGITGNGPLDRLKHRFMARQAENNLVKSIYDNQLREKLTPDYRFGCKRIVVSSSFYRAIQEDNAYLVTDPVERFVADGIITRDGTHHPLDVVVLATGFNPAAFMRPMEFKGRDGLDIEDYWRRKVRAYRSICIPGFPNYFLMLGPHTPIGNFSVIAMSEVQCAYALQLVDHWRKGTLATIEATERALEDWNAMLKANMGKTAWVSGGCQSWYLDADGDPLSWPDSWPKWVRAMKKPNLRDFVGGA